MLVEDPDSSGMLVSGSLILDSWSWMFNSWILIVKWKAFRFLCFYPESSIQHLVSSISRGWQ